MRSLSFTLVFTLLVYWLLTLSTSWSYSNHSLIPMKSSSKHFLPRLILTRSTPQLSTPQLSTIFTLTSCLKRHARHCRLAHLPSRRLLRRPNVSTVVDWDIGKRTAIKSSEVFHVKKRKLTERGRTKERRERKRKKRKRKRWQPLWALS